MKTNFAIRSGKLVIIDNGIKGLLESQQTKIGCDLDNIPETKEQNFYFLGIDCVFIFTKSVVFSDGLCVGTVEVVTHDEYDKIIKK
jgi:hypothetical protein